MAGSIGIVAVVDDSIGDVRLGSIGPGSATASGTTIRSRRRSTENSTSACGSVDDGLAGKPEGRAQERSTGVGGDEVLAAGLHLDDALAAATGRRHDVGTSNPRFCASSKSVRVMRGARAPD